MATPEALVTLVAAYRREAKAPGVPRPEFEIRLQAVGWPLFSGLLAGLLARQEGRLEYTVNAVAQPKQRESRIRQVAFDADGKQAGGGYYIKRQLAPPVRVRTHGAVGYSVALSSETPTAEFPLDAGAALRVRARVSFDLPPWRADLTVVRTLQGGEAESSLRGTVERMFRTRATPATFVERLELEARHPDYGFEVELEHVGDPEELRPADVAEGVAALIGLVDPGFAQEAAYQGELAHVAAYVAGPGGAGGAGAPLSLKALLPQVVALTRPVYREFYPPVGYFLLDKADGSRAVASARGGRAVILAEGLTVVPPRGGAEAGRPAQDTVVDGELVGGVFYAFDVVALRGRALADRGYEERAAALPEAVAELAAAGLDARAKAVVRLTASEPAALRAQVLSPAFADPPYETDGRILVEPGKPYRDTRAYKWKPADRVTVDFLARRAPPSARGAPPFADAPGAALHFLFVGANADTFRALGLELVPGYDDLFEPGTRGRGYFPVQFAPSNAPLAFLYQHPEGGADIDGRVVEMRLDRRAATRPPFAAWELVRVREDRARDLRSGAYFGNDFRVAELTWLDYFDPFEERLLWEGPGSAYFASAKSPVYQAQTAMTSFVKSRRIQQALFRAGWVVDAGVGKGQDLGRYARAEVGHVVGVDADREALAELVRRKYSAGERPGRRRRSPALYAVHADLSGDHAAVAASVRAAAPGFPERGADALVINLAIHYLAGSVERLRNFAALCADLVRPGGRVVVTAMFGERVAALLAREGVAPGGAWSLRVDGAVVYSIRRDYADDRLTPAGQQIGVLLPFSNGEYYPEFLVNTKALAATFRAYGFRLEEQTPFEAHFDEFRTENRAMASLLTPADREFLALYGELVFVRGKK